LIAPLNQQMMPPRLDAMADNDPLNISGQVVAEKYRIEHLVGEGGFAAVYLAEQTIWKQPVAVKFFSGLSQAPGEYRDELLQQFFQEGALLTELSSQTAGIVQARDVGAHTTPSGQWLPYMVLEWLDGSPLDAVLAEDQCQGRPWTEAQVVGFLRRILPILDVAHRRGICHRDIKPANIFVMGGDPRAADTALKLLDFGVAKMVADHAKVSAALAKTGVAISSFTPRYGAPEQFTRSHGATGPWTDVYAVALLACEMLAGRAALDGEDMVQFGFSSANPAQRPTPRALGAPISDGLEAVFAKALAVRPENRFQHAGEFLDSIATVTDRRPPVPVDAPASLDVAPSLSLPLAPTVLVRTDGTPVRPITTSPQAARPIDAPAARLARDGHSPPTKPEPEPKPEPKERKSGIGSFIFILLVVSGAVVAFSTTDLRGAKQVRDAYAPLLRLVKKEAAQQLPRLREKTRQAVDDAVDMLAGPAPTVAECPIGTRRVATPVHEPIGTAGGAPAKESVCVDNNLVAESDYDACPTCERPGSSRGKRRTGGHSGFCVDGKNPTTEPIRCVTWKQADIYCATRAARLPTEDELFAISPAALGPAEWTQPAPEASEGKWRPFRCARGP
jgi:eukaryotic-like serine/threonine-protein kinase